MKKCKECCELKSLDQFYNHKRGKFGKAYVCKICWNNRTEKYHKNNPDNRKAYLAKYMTKIGNKKSLEYFNRKKDGYHYVYYLPEEHYVGVTDNVKYRMYSHKSNFSRYTKDVEIVYRHTCRKEAELVESKLHSMGYQG